ncbi:MULTISPECIES: hypothetical protein [Catenuloplanes]|uniref:Uncharacterized protein n=1 Tax=Catenuloplanes niger TaxID=587534 RepID=A0AAE3ZV85_9ACTN|nr:hypothetical protein [Catenuloplanes niger]MDR7325779.1 hypothetical protein [Catenuloplanes niger]
MATPVPPISFAPLGGEMDAVTRLPLGAMHALVAAGFLRRPLP